MEGFRNIKTTTVDKVGLVELDRPEALNALCSDLMAELSIAIKSFAKDPKISAVVLTGSQKSFAGNIM